MMVLFYTFLSCSEEDTHSSIENPSGDCLSEDNGSRRCYHAPSATDRYLKDCTNGLQREYWRVFAQNEESAYIIPRPDGMGLFYDLCEDETVGELFETYALCEDFLGSDAVAIINDIPPSEALMITNRLHESLLFTVDDNDMISPWAPPNDIVDVCNMSDADDEMIADYCQTALDYYDSGEDCPSIAFGPSPEQALIVASRLNILYGIQ